MSQKVILIGGRTGGPILPLITMYHSLQKKYDLQAIIVGIKGGYEEKLAQREDLKIEFLPETKLKSSPRKFNFISWLLYLLETFGTLLIVLYSICISLIILLRYKPKMIISTGSFLAVPMVYATVVANMIFFQKIKIVVHQQDPLPGLANRLTIRFAHLKSYVFDYTALNYPQFAKAFKIPNPLDVANFDSEVMMKTALEIAETKPALHIFFRNLSPEKPLLLVFGGASGAEKINDWVIENLTMLKSRFSILHLTGSLQNKEYQLVETQGYLSIDSLSEQEMRLSESVCDLCICRAGLGSISELLYLHKPAYLVPIPNSHQEINAEQVSDFFYILNQNNQNQWLSKIFTSYPQFFNDIEYPNNSNLDEQLQKYYQQIENYL